MINSILLQVTQVVTTATDTIQKVSPQTVNILPKSEEISLWSMLLKGGPLMIPIVICSLLAVYFFFERLIAIQKAGRSDSNFMNNIKDFIYDGKLDAAKSLCKATNSPVSRMVEKGLSRLGRPISEIERTLESIGKFETSKLEKNLKIIGIIAGIAPMLGFIGTIMGVIIIFHDISLSENISVGIVANGLYVKMISSASGLVVGMVAYTGYHYLNILLDKVVFKMENNALDFLDLLQQKA
jgi:biopolymer transport protein ExbB